MLSGLSFIWFQNYLSKWNGFSFVCTIVAIFCTTFVFVGKQPPQPETEPMDLPDDLQLDDGDGNDKDEEGEENPFDIDAMKGFNFFC